MILTIVITILALFVIIAGALIQNKADVAAMNGRKIVRKGKS